MSVSLAPLAKMQFNQLGIPVAGGKLFTYAPGTTTKQNTYTDSTGATPNANPIILDANGQCDLWLLDGYAYKLVLSPSTDTDPPTNPYWTEDNVSNNIIPFSPTFGVMTATTATIGTLTVTGTINKVTLTQPATAATITIANNKTFTCSNTLTFTGTDGITVAFGGGLSITAAKVLTASNTMTLTADDGVTAAFGGGLSIATGKVLTNSNTLTMTATDGSTAAFGAGGTVAYKGLTLAQFAATTSLELKTLISDETGSGALVFANTPTLVTPALGAATATSINAVTITAPATAATLTIANNGSLITAGAFAITLTATNTTGVTLPTSGTLAVTTQATDTFGALTDITTNNVSATAHGFCPKFPNNSTTFLRGDGTYAVPSQSAQGIPYTTRSSNTILAAVDQAKFFNATSGFTQTLTAAATLGSGWWVFYTNSSSSNVTFDPNASELIDGAVTGILRPGMTILIMCDGAAFNCQSVGQKITELLTSGTSWTSPLGVRAVESSQVGGGGGAGLGPAGNNYAGANSGAAAIKQWIVSPNTAYTYAIGAAGSAAGGSNTDGGAGGNTTFAVGATTVTTNGGAGGNGATLNIYQTAAQTSTNGDVNINSSLGWSTNASSGQFSKGADAPLGFGSGGYSVPSVTSIAPTGYGSGAASGTSTGTARAGQQGAIILRY